MFAFFSFFSRDIITRIQSDVSRVQSPAQCRHGFVEPPTHNPRADRLWPQPKKRAPHPQAQLSFTLYFFTVGTKMAYVGMLLSALYGISSISDLGILRYMLIFGGWIVIFPFLS